MILWSYHVFRFDFDPILVASIESVLRTWMLQDETFPSCCHDLIHFVPDVFRGFALKLRDEFHASRYLLDACA